MQLYVDKIRELRKQNKITFSKLASLMGKSLRTVSSWETQKRIPTESDVRVIAQILNVNPSEISDLKDFKLTNEPYFKEQFGEIDQIQRKYSFNP